MNKLLTRSLAFVTVALSLAACPSNAGNTPDLPDNNSGQAFIASGIVKDTQGKPLSGVKVILDNTVYFNSGQTKTTGADGRYSFKLERGSWRVYAKITRQYHGRSFKFDLHPDTYDSFAGQDGAVRNFVWKLQGEQPEPSVGHYGGSVYIVRDPDTSMYDTENIEFTFTPDGPIIDGSAGRTFKGQHNPPNHKYPNRFPDVPIGRYKVTGRYLPTGQAVLIRLNKIGSQYAQSLTFDFEEELNYCTNCVSLEVTLP